MPAERGDSLGGLVFNTLGHAPRRGEVVTLMGYEFVVVDVSGSRITRLRVRRRPEADTPSGAAEPGVRRGPEAAPL